MKFNNYDKEKLYLLIAEQNSKLPNKTKSA